MYVYNLTYLRLKKQTNKKLLVLCNANLDLCIRDSSLRDQLDLMISGVSRHTLIVLPCGSIRPYGS